MHSSPPPPPLTQRYCQALRSQPNCPPEVRLGIAACQWQLGNVAQARAAYQRILALSPTNVDALLGLALLDINRGDVESVSQGLHLLQEAYRANAEHPIVCLVLARYFLLKNRPDKVAVVVVFFGWVYLGVGCVCLGGECVCV